MLDYFKRKELKGKSFAAHDKGILFAVLILVILGIAGIVTFIMGGSVGGIFSGFKIHISDIVSLAALLLVYIIWGFGKRRNKGE